VTSTSLIVPTMSSKNANIDEIDAFEQCQRELIEAEIMYSAAARNGNAVAELKLQKAHRDLEFAQRRAAITRTRQWHSALNKLYRLGSNIYKITSEAHRVAVSDRETLGDPTVEVPPHSGFVDEHCLLLWPNVDVSIDDFFANARVPELNGELDFDGVMNAWWDIAREFKLPDSNCTFGELLSDLLNRQKQAKVADIAPVFASLMFELMVLLSKTNDSLFLYSRANLLKKLPWPAIEDAPEWLVHQCDDPYLKRHRKVDLAVFSHPGKRDTKRFNACAQRSVCTAIELMSNIAVPIGPQGHLPAHTRLLGNRRHAVRWRAPRDVWHCGHSGRVALLSGLV
jgi:hypothetical protein